MERVTDDAVAKVRAGLATSASVGQRRMRALHNSGGRRDRRDLASTRTCGPALGWSAPAPARPWSAATSRSPI